MPIERLEEEEEKVWHEQQEKILKEWAEKAMCYRWMHDRAFRIYKKENMRFAIPVIILSTITGTANFAQESFPEFMKEYVPMGIGALNLVAGLLTTISQFLRVNELQEGHRVATISFAKFSRTIALELSLPKADRDSSGKEFIMQCCQELDRLIEQSPQIPKEILDLFKKRHGHGNIELPEILQLKKVTIFKDNDPNNSLVNELKEETDTVLSIDSAEGCFSKLKKSIYGESVEGNLIVPLEDRVSLAETQAQEALIRAETQAQEAIVRAETQAQEAVNSAVIRAETQAQEALIRAETQAQEALNRAETQTQEAVNRAENQAQEAIDSAINKAEIQAGIFSKSIEDRIRETEENLRKKCEEAEQIIAKRFDEADKIISEKLTEAERDIAHINQHTSEN